MFTVKLGCNLSTPCRGAFLLCFTASFCDAGRTDDVGGGRLAASDFTVGPGQTADLPVAMTTLGEEVATLPGGFRSAVLIDLLNHAIVQVGPAPSFANKLAPSGAALDLTTADKGYAPPGRAIAACEGKVFVGANTSCGFANAVEVAYFRAAGENPNATANAAVTAASPVTKQVYTMHCVGASPHVCTGATSARVIFY